METEQKRRAYFSKLIKISEEDYYNPFEYFNWPDHISDDVLWMSPELLSIANTPYLEESSFKELCTISKYELINFFSLSINGEKNIKIEMLKHITNKYFKESSEYFNYFLREENSHIYFFSRFCNTYGGKIYEYKKIPFNGFNKYEIDRYVIFIQTLIAEEIGDYFNVVMSKDERLPEIIREINRRHHIDESRHIGMGKELVKGMWGELLKKCSAEEISKVQAYLVTFINAFINDFYNPEMYRDSGFSDAFNMRTTLMQHPGRQSFNIQIVSKLERFLKNNEMINNNIVQS